MQTAVERMAEERAIWQSKPSLRALYGDYYRRMSGWARPGRTLELGGGTGNLKGWLSDIVTTDIQFAPWLDAVADAQRLPFVDNSFANLVMFDVLHHIERPLHFLREAARVLEPGGRLIVLEPWASPVSRLVYGLFHPEPIDLSVDPLDDSPVTPGRDPWLANQGIPTLLFGRERQRLARALPTLRVMHLQRLALFAFPLSGGFRRWSLIPGALVPPVARLEDLLLPVLGSAMAFRMLGVIERVTDDGGQCAADSPNAGVHLEH
jgi:SAM-dependent methyltransferase